MCIYIHVQVYIYMYIYIYTCICVCVCICDARRAVALVHISKTKMIMLAHFQIEKKLLTPQATNSHCTHTHTHTHAHAHTHTHTCCFQQFPQTRCTPSRGGVRWRAFGGKKFGKKFLSHNGQQPPDYWSHHFQCAPKHSKRRLLVIPVYTNMNVPRTVI